MKKLIIGLCTFVLLTGGFVGGNFYKEVSTKPAPRIQHYVEGVQIINGKAQLELWGQFSGYFSKMFYRDVKMIKLLGIKELEIFIMSPGGMLVDALAVIDMIHELQEAGVHITAIARGAVWSAAVPVFACADTRIASENTAFMVHKPEISAYANENDRELYDLQLKQYLTILANYTTLCYAEWEKLLDEFTWFTVREAKDFGLVDRIE